MKHIGMVQWVMLAMVVALYAFGIVSVDTNGSDVLSLMLPLAFGTVTAAAGSPDHTYATGSGEIPVLFADKTVEVFYDVSVAPFVANSDYEGGH